MRYYISVRFARRAGLGRSNAYWVTAESETEARRKVLAQCAATHPGNRARVVSVERDDDTPQYVPLFSGQH